MNRDQFASREASDRGHTEPSEDWTQRLSYWRNAMPAGHHWPSCVNAYGLRMTDCGRLYEHDHQQMLSSAEEELAKTDRYQLENIHLLATDECNWARHGQAIGYSWTDMLLYYASQADFQEALIELGPLPNLIEKPGPEDVLRSLWDRQTWYNARLAELRYRYEDTRRIELDLLGRDDNELSFDLDSTGS
ncbi:MAG: hypothetical protein AAF449_15445 [Myxococcota bacterium]